MTKLLQQALDALIESRDDVDLCYAGVKAARLSFRQERQLGFYEEQLIKHDAAIEALKQALAQQEQCGCREGECETKKDKTCRMTIEIAERDGIPEWTPAIGIECAISNLRDDAARLRDGGYTPLQIADDLDVIANDLGKCNPVAQQEQPASVDAYVGAREDAEIWKKRALEAEELNRKFIAELNGPTYLGEPAQQERPAQKPDLWKTQFLTDVMTSAGLLMHGRTDKKLAQRIADGSARWRTELYASAPTQPAQGPVTRPEPFKIATPPPLAAAFDVVFAEGWNACCDEFFGGKAPQEPLIITVEIPAPTQPSLSDDEILNCFYASKSEGMVSYMLAVGRAIEAHCRGCANK